MKIRHSSKSFKSKPSKNAPTSSSDNLLFSPSELGQMHHSEKWSKILKIAIPCLLVAIVGTATYAIINHSSVDTNYSSSQSSAPASTNATKSTDSTQQKTAALEAQAQQKQQQQAQQQCQSAKQKLATDQATLSSDQASLSSAQEQYSSDQQELASAEQSLPTEGGVEAPYTQALIQAIQQEKIPADQNLINSAQNLITSVQAGVNQDQDFISHLGCY
jgi:signal recognition particle GTPase